MRRLFPDFLHYSLMCRTPRHVPVHTSVFLGISPGQILECTALAEGWHSWVLLLSPAQAGPFCSTRPGERRSGRLGALSSFYSKRNGSSEWWKHLPGVTEQGRGKDFLDLRSLGKNKGRSQGRGQGLPESLDLD